MVLRPTSRFWPIHVAGGCLLLHAAVLILFPSYSDARSYFCMGLAVVFAIVGAQHQSQGATGALRLAWRLWELVLVLRFTLLMQDALLSSGVLPAYLQFKTIWLGSVVMGLTLLAVSCTADEKATLRIRLADGLAALMISLLVLANVFLPSVRLTNVPALLYLILIIDSFVALVAIVAVFGAADKRIRQFQTLVAIYLLVHLAAAILINNVSYILLRHQRANAIDLIADVAPLLFGVLAFLRPVEEPTPLKRSWFNYVIQSAMPFVPGMAAFALGVRLVFDYPVAGSSGMTLAVLGAGFRAVMVQSRYLTMHERIEMQNAELHEMIEQDALTGVGNRLAFQRMMQHEWNDAQRSGLPLSLLMIDVDYLKQVNDTFGHARGDQCLVAVTRVLRGASVRVVGHLSRVGGDEFALILHRCDLKNAMRAAERARTAVAELGFDSGNGRRVSLSIGIATQEEDASFADLTEMIEAADKALYRAKVRGRDAIVAHVEDATGTDA